MKKPVRILTLLLMVAVVIALVFILKDPPIKIDGATEYSNLDEDLKLVLGIENYGFEKVKIKEISVNGNESRYHVSIGVGNQLVMGDVDNQQIFTFHQANELSILPVRDLFVRSRGNILHYGIVIRGEVPVNSVEIKYTY